jgi:hypothetical protein
MSENTALWDKLGKTDPAHTKKFKRSGGFEGTAIKPMWSYRRLTEEFGPCGTGWGHEEPKFTVVPGHNGEVLVYCTVSGWYMSDDDKKHVHGVGGDKVVTYIKANEQYKRPERWENDDEAFKKAFTDGLTNAFKFIGVGADVHMGMFDDSKYVNAVGQEFAQEKEQSTKSSAQLKRDGSWEKIMADLEADLVDVNSGAALDNLRKSYLDQAERDGWTAAWRAALLDRLEGCEADIRRENLWVEMISISTLGGLQSFWEENLPTIKGLGSKAAADFTKKKDEMKNALLARTSNLAAG